MVLPKTYTYSSLEFPAFSYLEMKRVDLCRISCEAVSAHEDTLRKIEVKIFRIENRDKR